MPKLVAEKLPAVANGLLMVKLLLEAVLPLV